MDTLRTLGIFFYFWGWGCYVYILEVDLSIVFRYYFMLDFVVFILLTS